MARQQAKAPAKDTWSVLWLCAVCGELHESEGGLERDGVTPSEFLALQCPTLKAAGGYAATQRLVKLPVQRGRKKTKQGGTR